MNDKNEESIDRLSKMPVEQYSCIDKTRYASYVLGSSQDEDGRRHPDSNTALQRRQPQKRRDSLNPIVQVMIQAVCYILATCSAFVLEAYHPHPYRTFASNLDFEERCSEIGSAVVKLSQQLLRYLQLEAVIDRVGQTSKMDNTNSRIETFMVGTSDLIGIRLTLA
jgi:hypothetical protein